MYNLKITKNVTIILLGDYNQNSAINQLYTTDSKVVNYNINYFDN